MKAEGAERPRTRGRQKYWIVAGAVVVLVAGLGVAEATGGVVTRFLDTTGITCGGPWERLPVDELADYRLHGWDDPEVADLGFDRADFTDLPDELAQPTLTTGELSTEDDYAPVLLPLGDGVVLQNGGYIDQTWVGSDAHTGEVLWGFTGDSGFSSVQGKFGFVSERDESRTDLTVFDPRTGEKLSCSRLGGEVLQLTGVGDDDFLVLLDNDEGYVLIRLDPRTGETRWREAGEEVLPHLHTHGEIIVLSRFSAKQVSSSWWGGAAQNEAVITGIDADTGEPIWRRQAGEGQTAVVGLAPLPTGEMGSLVLEVTSLEEAYQRRAKYRMLDSSGEELWSTPTNLVEASGDDAPMWATDSALVVLNGEHLQGLDLGTGDELWRSVSVAFSHVGVLRTSDDPDALLVTDPRDGRGSFTLLIDPATGEERRYESALRGVTLTDDYLLTHSSTTEIVIPRTD